MGGRFYDPRATFFDQPVSDLERMREREMRICLHPRHPGYQLRERSPVGFPRHESHWDSSGFGFFTPFEDQRGRYFDHGAEFCGGFSRDPTDEFNRQHPSDKREGVQGYFCGDRDFYFFNEEDSLCYDAKGYCYLFEQDGFYYDIKSGGRCDAGGFPCDEKGARNFDMSDVSDEDTSAGEPRPVNKTVPVSIEKSVLSKKKDGG